MTAGQQTVKALKPLGCALVLLIMVAYFIMCFTTKAPLEDYQRKETSDYYAENMEELKVELEENMFPLIEGTEACELDGSVLTVYLEPEHFDDSKKIITHYYSDELFNFEKYEKG